MEINAPPPENHLCRGRRIVVLGAGSSGLSVAWGLSERDGYEVTVIESNSRVGGLSRTIEHDGVRFDIGPHRLSPQLPGIVEKVRHLLGDDLKERKNIHGVYFNGMLYTYPPAVKDFLNLSSLKSTAEFGTSWLWARFSSFLRRLAGGKDSSFEGILKAAFGGRFYEKVISPMVSKVWGTDDLHSEFAKLRFEMPTVPYILKKILARDNRASNSVFYYPAEGFGQIFDSIGKLLREKGQRIELSADIVSIEAGSLKGPFRVSFNQDGVEKVVECDILVSTVSNKDLLRYLAGTGLVGPVLSESDKFVSRTMRLGVLCVKNFHLTSRIVIFPESRFLFNRISEMNYFSDLGYAQDETILLVDTICDAGSVYDVLPEKDFNRILLEAVLTLGWFRREDVNKQFSLRIPNAYPILNRMRYEAQERVEDFFEGTSVLLCGREASSDYNNAHNAMGKGFLTARYVAGEVDLRSYREHSRVIGRLPIED